MNCPVCDHQDLPKDAESCAHCGSDLGAFHAIQRVHKQRRNYRTTSVVLAALALLAIVYIAVLQSAERELASPDTVEQATLAISADMSATASEVDKLESILIVKDAEIEHLKSEIAELEATMHSSFDDVETEDRTIHVVKAGESLWSISEMYHGHGFKHLSIAGHNDLEDVDHIEVGDTIIIHH